MMFMLTAAAAAALLRYSLLLALRARFELCVLLLLLVL
jgi:hypothetical protein